jgi:hypothetical protein
MDEIQIWRIFLFFIDAILLSVSIYMIRASFRDFKKVDVTQTELRPDLIKDFDKTLFGKLSFWNILGNKVIIGYTFFLGIFFLICSIVLLFYLVVLR